MNLIQKKEREKNLKRNYICGNFEDIEENLEVLVSILEIQTG